MPPPFTNHNQNSGAPHGAGLDFTLLVTKKLYRPSLVERAFMLQQAFCRWPATRRVPRTNNKTPLRLPSLWGTRNRTRPLMILKRIYFAIFIGEVGSAIPSLNMSREGNAFCRGHLFWKSFPDRGGRCSQRSSILCWSLWALDPKTRRVLSLLRGSNPACVPEHGRRKELLPLRIRPSRLWTQSSPVLSKRELTARRRGQCYESVVDG